MSNANADSFDCTAVGGRARAAAVLRLLLPQRCELCVGRTDGALLCDACTEALPRVGAACPVCALPSTRDGACGACLAHPPPYAGAIAAFAYAFPVDRLLQRLKYGGRIALAQWAGAALAAVVCATFASRMGRGRPDRIVALPLAVERQRDRGFNQAREIAARVARGTGLPLAAPLARITTGPPQTALPWAARHRSVRGAFTVRTPVCGARIALVDDVMTTGATLAEASRTLLSAGAERVECWVVARTLPP